MEELIQFLRSFNLLTEEDIQIIAESTNIQHFPKGTLLLKEGQIAKECYSILKGCVREYYLIDGEERTTEIFTEGQPVNSFTSATTQSPSKHYLECVEDCTLTVGTQDLEKEMCKRIPKLESIIKSEVEKETGKMQDHFARFKTSSPEERYLHLLETRGDLFNRLPQHQIASYLGIKPESLSRIRKRLLKKEQS